MRQSPDLNDEYDLKDLEKLNAKEWQLDLLKKNPRYVYWGNYEDYMSDKGNGWGSAVEVETFKDRFALDELNELANFYFEVHRANHTCPHCDGTNLNPATKQIDDDFENTGRKWCYNITDVEVEALVRGGRISDLLDGWYHFNEDENTWEVLDQNVPYSERKWVSCDAPKFPTAEAVNKWANGGGIGGHDAINKWICVEARAKHLGVYGHCEHCVDGYIYDEPDARVSLQLWMLHPRKGASRGVYIKNIEESEVPEVIAYLKEAAERNADRFSQL